MINFDKFVKSIETHPDGDRWSFWLRIYIHTNCCIGYGKYFIVFPIWKNTHIGIGFSKLWFKSPWFMLVNDYYD